MKKLVRVHYLARQSAIYHTCIRARFRRHPVPLIVGSIFLQAQCHLFDLNRITGWLRLVIRKFAAQFWNQRFPREGQLLEHIIASVGICDVTLLRSDNRILKILRLTWIASAIVWGGGSHGSISWPRARRAFATVSSARWIGGCGLATPSKSINPNDRLRLVVMYSCSRQGSGTTSGSYNHGCSDIRALRKYLKEETEDPKIPGTVLIMVCPGDYRNLV